MLKEVLKQKFPQLGNLRVRDIRVDKPFKKVYCVLSFPEGEQPNEKLRPQLRQTVAQQMPQGYRCEVSFVTDRFTDRSLAMLVADVIKKKYPVLSLPKEKISAKVQDRTAVVRLFVTENARHNMETADFPSLLRQFFEEYTCYDVQVSLEEDKLGERADVAEQEKLVRLAVNKELLKPQRYFDVTDVQKYIGKLIQSKPMYISDVRSPMENCVVCGRISEKQLRAAKNNAVLKICKFTLTDGSDASLPCVMFVRFQIEDVNVIKQTTDKSDAEALTISRKQKLANDKKMKMLSFLTDGTEVLVRGKVVYSSFSQGLEMQVYDVCKCRIAPLGLQPKLQKRAPAQYVLVQPQQISEYRQLSFTGWEEKPSLLSGRHFVALYANVTGYNVTKDKVFSLCGVRIKDGHMTEMFHTLVMPEIELSEGQLKDADATVKQIMLSPTITEVIADLYKFVGDAVLVGADLPLLLQLLNYYAAPIGYSFANRTTSQTEMLSRLFENSTLDARPTYSQLKEVAKALKVTAPQTASAKDNALALARCMTSLARFAK